MTTLPVGDLVWGGDWNHAMHGGEYSGSLAGRTAIQNVLAGHRLKVATHRSPHRMSGLFTIDHIAVPETAQILTVNPVIPEDVRGHQLSDHDAYTAELAVI